MRSLALSQPEDSYTQCVLLLLMLNGELLSRLLSFSFAPNGIIKVLAHVFAQPQSPKLVCSSLEYSETCIYLKHTEVQQHETEELPHNIS